MKSTIHLILALLWACVAYGDSQQAASPAPLDLNACYARALEHNERIGIAAAEWRAAEARYRQARDSLLPALSFEGSALFQNDRRTEDNRSASREPERYEARLRAEQVLYQGFRLTREAEAGAAQGRAAEWDSRRVRELLYLDVADAFHQVLLYEQDVRLLDRLVEVLEQSVAELERRVTLGRSRAADLLQARTALAEAGVELETARGAAAVARELLAFLIDQPANSWTLADASPFPATPELEDKLTRASLRADLQAAEARAESARRLLQAAQGARQPEVTAEGNYYVYEDPDDDQGWDVLLKLSVPLFDEGVRRSRSRESMEQARISELNLASLRRRAAGEVRNAYLAFMSAVAQRARLKEAVAAAKASYEAQERDYRLGRASQLESLAALAQVQRLARREQAVEQQARVSLIRLHVAAGEVQP